MFAESIIHPCSEYHFFMIFHFHLFLNMICGNFVGIFLSSGISWEEGLCLWTCTWVWGLWGLSAYPEGMATPSPAQQCVYLPLPRSHATDLLCVGRQHLLCIFPEFVNFLYSFLLWAKVCFFLAYLVLFCRWRQPALCHLMHKFLVFLLCPATSNGDFWEALSPHFKSIYYDNCKNLSSSRKRARMISLFSLP